jgi:hypothetical protein
MGMHPAGVFNIEMVAAGRLRSRASVTERFSLRRQVLS